VHIGKFLKHKFQKSIRLWLKNLLITTTDNCKPSTFYKLYTIGKLYIQIYVSEYAAKSQLYLDLHVAQGSCTSRGAELYNSLCGAHQQNLVWTC